MATVTGMKTVLVTGAHGFIGRNLVAHLRTQPNIEILEFGTENTVQDLQQFLHEADIVYHIAGVNRPQSESEFQTVNTDLTAQLLSILEASQTAIPVVFTSSIQATLDNPYGHSKKRAEELVFAYGRRLQTPVYVYRLPNVFGKWCRPNYNSVVATLCHNISRDLQIQISNPDVELQLVYVDDVISSFLEVLSNSAQPQEDGYCYISRLFQIKLQALSDLIKSFHESRQTSVLPDMNVPLIKFLYSTYLSYLPTTDFSYSPDLKIDPRGWLFELIKSPSIGQIFLSQTKPGITRGGHYHHTKVEKFIVVQGDAVVRFRHIGSSDVIQYKVSGADIRIIDIPPGYTHDITNVGTSDLITLFWACEIFNPIAPDTYIQEVMP